MRAYLWLLLWLPVTVASQWVAFTPCGLKPTEKIEHGYEAFAGPAPNISVVYVWVPAVTAVVGFPKTEDDDAECSLILIATRQVYIVGSPEDVLGWLERRE